MTVKGDHFTRCDTVTALIQSRAAWGLEPDTPVVGTDSPRGG